VELVTASGTSNAKLKVPVQVVNPAPSHTSLRWLGSEDRWYTVAPQLPYGWTPHVAPTAILPEYRIFCQQLCRKGYGRTCGPREVSPVDCSNAPAVGHAPSVFGRVTCSAPPYQLTDYAEATIEAQPCKSMCMPATAPGAAAVVVSSVPTDNITVVHVRAERFITTAQFVEVVRRLPKPGEHPASGLQRGQQVVLAPGRVVLAV
jgi:hypothetical protein